MFMEKMTEKQKRAAVTLTVSLAVYLTVKFLLPVIWPFLLAYLIADMVLFLADWLYKKTRLKKSAAAVIVLLLAVAILLLPALYLVKSIIAQTLRLCQSLPDYAGILGRWLDDFCLRANSVFNVDERVIKENICQILRNGAQTAKESIMPWMMGHFPALVLGFVSASTVAFLACMAVILCLKEMDGIRSFEKNSVFSREISMIKSPMIRVGKAYLKTQVFIMLLVMGELMLGLSLMKNPYSMLLGLLIGLLDALPLFGTGTVLLPWIFLEIILGKWKTAATVGIMYLVCYFTRQVLEPKLMGDGTGLTSLQSLMAIYAGLKLFGLWGLFLGPICLIIIKEFVSAHSSRPEQDFRV